MSENEYNFKIGQRIKEARKSQKITLKELGTSVGISESTTKRYEDGQIKGVDVNIIKKFAAALNVSPAWLMGYDDAPAAPLPNGSNPLPKGSSTLSQDESLVLSKYRRLSPDGKEYIHDQLNFRLDKEAADEKKETHTA